MSDTPNEMPEAPRKEAPHNEEAIQEILRRVEEKLRRKLRLGTLTLDEIEEQSQDIGEEVKRIVEEESLQSVGTGQCGSFQTCSQGHRARYGGLRSRQLVTLSGTRWLRRAYYYCPKCGGGWCPTDQRLGIGRGQCSRRVQALIARFSSYLPYRTVAQEMEIVCGLRLATSTIERYAQALGQRLQQEWEQLEQVRETEELPASQMAAKQRPARLHVTMDGVMAHVGGDWHEVKLGCVYQTSAKGIAVRTRYVATLSPSVIFGKRLRVLAHQAGSDRCRDVAVVADGRDVAVVADGRDVAVVADGRDVAVVADGRDVAVVADGAEWIWQETGKHFPRSVQVVDFYHVTEHLWAFAQARFGEGTVAGSEWMGVQKERLLADKIALVIAEVSGWSSAKAADQEMQRRLVGYLSKHQTRMRYPSFREAGYPSFREAGYPSFREAGYPSFREAGYPIGSGVAESGCKNVVQQRMKGSGMRWSRVGAEAQLQLCAHWKSQGAKDFHAYTAPRSVS